MSLTRGVEFVVYATSLSVAIRGISKLGSVKAFTCPFIIIVADKIRHSNK